MNEWIAKGVAYDPHDTTSYISLVVVCLRYWTIYQIILSAAKKNCPADSQVKLKTLLYFTDYGHMKAKSPILCGPNSNPNPKMNI